MTIYQIEAYVKLATTLNFTKASTLLHMSQPNLSKLINNMEQELDVQLLLRNRRAVSLTPAGKAFQESAEKIIDTFKAAEARVKDIDIGNSGTIKIGFLSTALIHHLPILVRKFNESYPNISLKLYDYTFSPLMSSLLDNTMDIALLPDRELDNIPKLEKKFLYADDMCVVLPNNHPLNAGDGVDLNDFAEVPFILMDPNVSDRDYDLVYSICMANGFYPKIHHTVNSLNNLLLMVECGRGVSILARHMEHYATDNLSFISIKGSEKSFKMVSAWRRDRNPCIAKFNEVIDECFNKVGNKMDFSIQSVNID